MGARLFFATVLLAGLLAAGEAGAAPAACATGEPQLRAALQARYAALKAAMTARDGGAIAAILAPGFVSEETTGAVSDARHMIDGLMKLPPDPKKASSTELLTVAASGGDAVVRQRYHMTTVTAGSDGNERAIELTAESTDMWACAGGAWLLKLTRTEQMDVLVNGVRAMHAVRGQAAN